MEVASRKPIPDEIKNVQSLSMWLDMSARRMQTASTATMIFGVHFLGLLHFPIHGDAATCSTHIRTHLGSSRFGGRYGGNYSLCAGKLANDQLLALQFDSNPGAIRLYPLLPARRNTLRISRNSLILLGPPVSGHQDP